MSAAIVALLAVGALVTKSTDLVRNALDKARTAPKWIWNVVPLAIGVAYCLDWQVQVASAFAQAIPALASHAAAFAGVPGEIFTGLIAGAVAGGWHEVFDALSGIASANHAAAKPPAGPGP